MATKNTNGTESKAQAQPRRTARVAAMLAVLVAVIATMLPAPLAAETAVVCGGQAATIVGTDGNDVLTGTAGPDVIAGLGGNDVLRGLGGDDVICGGEGRDKLFGGRGNDVLFGGKRNDIVKGDGGQDHLLGNQGNDRLIGGGGADRLEGGSGVADRLTGKGGIDHCTDPQPSTTYVSCEHAPTPPPAGGAQVSVGEPSRALNPEAPPAPTGPITALPGGAISGVSFDPDVAPSPMPPASRSLNRSQKGHMLWLDINFDPDVYEDIVVIWGDGSPVSRLRDFRNAQANVVFGGDAVAPISRWHPSHAYPITREKVTHTMQIIWGATDGSDGVENFEITTQAVFDMTYSPLRFTMLNGCDTPAKINDGDFTVTWDQGRGSYTTPKFHLGVGDSTSIDDFSFARPLEADLEWYKTLKLSAREHDHWLARVGAVWKWDWGYSFEGVAPGGPDYVAREMDDHSYTIVRASTDEAGIDGDDDCIVQMVFDVSLELYRG